MKTRRTLTVQKLWLVYKKSVECLRLKRLSDTNFAEVSGLLAEAVAIGFKYGLTPDSEPLIRLIRLRAGIRRLRRILARKGSSL
jgi:hypothetical protein